MKKIQKLTVIFASLIVLICMILNTGELCFKVYAKTVNEKNNKIIYSTVDSSENITADESAVSSQTDTTTKNSVNDTSNDTSNSSEADTNTNNLDVIKGLSKGVIKIIASYKDSSGKTYVVKQGNGFLLGQSDGTEKNLYIVTDYKVVENTSELRKKLNNQGVSDTGLEMIYTAYLGNGLEVELELSFASEEGNYAILTFGTSVANINTLVLGDTTSKVVGEKVYVIGCGGNLEEIKTEKALLNYDQKIISTKLTQINVEKLKNEDRTFLDIEAEVDDGMSGSPLLDDKGTVIGMLVYRDGKIGILSAQNIKTVLDSVGLSYSIGVNDYDLVTPGMVSELKEELAKSKKLLKEGNRTKYTTKSWDTLYTSVQNAEKLILGGSSSYKEYRDALKDIKKSQRKLKKQGFVFFVIDLIALLILAIVLWLFIKHFRKGRELRRVNSSAKKKIRDGRENVIDLSGVLTRKPEDYAKNININDGPMAEYNNFENRVYAKLVNTRSGYEIYMNKEQMKIGSDASSVDLVVQNPSVSRRHATISISDGMFYITDNNSTNGTSLNGVRLAPSSTMQINTGDTIGVSDSFYVFEIM